MALDRRKGLQTAERLLKQGKVQAALSELQRVSGRSIGPHTETALAELRTVIAASASIPGPLADSALALAPDEVFSNTAVVLFGAIETTEGMVSNALWHLLTVPGLLGVARRDRARIADIVEESLRLEPAAAVVDRYATRDVDVCGAGLGLKAASLLTMY